MALISHYLFKLLAIFLAQIMLIFSIGNKNVADNKDNIIVDNKLIIFDETISNPKFGNFK